MRSGRKSSSVDKAFELIGAVSEAGGAGLTLGELAAEAGIAVSTTHRYTTSLLELGVLERDPAGAFHLGVTLIALAGQYLDEDGLRAAARPYLVDLVELSGETVHLGVPVGNRIVYVDKVESAKSVRLVSRIGSRVAMHSTAMGKAVLAVLDERRRAEILAAGLPARTGRTLTGAALLAELDLVRTRGFAIDDEENEEGVRCFGLPIMSVAGEPVGAFSVSAPAHRFSIDDCHRLAPAALAMAVNIGRRLGYPDRRGRRVSGTTTPTWSTGSGTPHRAPRPAPTKPPRPSEPTS
ncbi:IclR family transcriptional regulator [Micromonospora pisi]|uniref:IclR family transcriptional regulator n=1 Tax=Micromonospora pisi TaxID=589240 RepID=A0A495JFE0_9ACTN|nr:IclR family transcriptional regulator [Micromonospora pisi]RKR87094.1 IclR family transcriptional regulator [Micromonospora pisi]